MIVMIVTIMVSLSGPASASAEAARQEAPAVLDEAGALVNRGLLHFRAGRATEAIADPQRALRHHGDPQRSFRQLRGHGSHWQRSREQSDPRLAEPQAG